MFKIVFKILFIFYLSINISYAEIVKSIDIKGNSRVNSETIKMFVNVKIGDDLTSNDLNKALKSLYETNFFEDVKIELTNSILKITVDYYSFLL